ncbi:MAG TPA: hypothetical protein VF600_06175 [Abditibacteriaceae bacterium]|jgi:hypothetical protein
MMDAQDEHHVLTPRSFEHLVGLRLSEARHSLEEDNSCASWPLEVIETSPPQAPQRSSRATPRKANHDAPRHAARPEKQFGEWRVLRCLVQEHPVQERAVQEGAASHRSPGLQLLVAREELKPLPAKNALSENAASESVSCAENASFQSSLNP